MRWLREHGLSCIKKKRGGDEYVCYYKGYRNAYVEILPDDKARIVVEGDAFMSVAEERVGDWPVNEFLEELKRVVGATSVDLDVPPTSTRLIIEYDEASKKRWNILNTIRRIVETDFGVEYLVGPEGRLRLYLGSEIAEPEKVLEALRKVSKTVKMGY